MRALLPALLILSSHIVSAATAPAAAGRLCVEAQPCTTTPMLDAADFAAAETPRAFTWVGADERRIVAGTVAAGATKITAPSASFALRLSSNGGQIWPVPVEMSIRATNSDRSWLVPLTSRQAKTGVEVYVEPGEYEIALRAAGYRRTTHRQRAAAEASVLTVALQPLPRISGRIVASKTNEPIAGGTVAIDERIVAVTGPDGRFSFDAEPDTWPETLVVSAAGYGSSNVTVPRARANTDLQELPLSVGASIVVTVEGPAAAPAVEVQIFKRRHAMPDDKPIKVKTLEKESPAITFENIEAGDYLVLARGKAPGEQVGKQISVALGEEKKVTLSPTPLRVFLRAELADTPLPGVHVDLTHSEGLWREQLQTDASGSARLALWQPGPIVALVHDDVTLPTPHREKKLVTGDGETEWIIHVSTREVRGQVVDAATGKPISNANVMLEVRGTQRYSAVTKADRDGRFVFTAAQPGEHRVAAAADGYSHDSVRYTFAESEQTHEVVVRLTGAHSTRVSVRDASGVPVPDALVLDFAGQTLMGQRTTDAAGSVVVPVDAKEIRDVYVVPRDGGFAAGTIRGGEDLTVRVLPPQATLVVSSVSTRKQPVPGVWVIIRHNGVALPMEVLQALASQQGAKTVGGADGRIVLHHMPLGVYEFWPVGSAGEARAVMTGLGKDAPVTIVARPGLNEATLTFSETKKP